MKFTVQPTNQMMGDYFHLHHPTNCWCFRNPNQPPGMQYKTIVNNGINCFFAGFLNHPYDSPIWMQHLKKSTLGWVLCHPLSATKQKRQLWGVWTWNGGRDDVGVSFLWLFLGWNSDEAEVVMVGKFFLFGGLWMSPVLKWKKQFGKTG